MRNDQELIEALDSGDNLAFYKALRKSLTHDYVDTEEPAERNRIMKEMLKVNREIERIEGAKNKFAPEVEKTFSDDDIFRKNFSRQARK